jgi:2,3-bisphosphoglycerate-dependent phosphoglycerate mutase
MREKEPRPSRFSISILPQFNLLYNYVHRDGIPNPYINSAPAMLGDSKKLSTVWLIRHAESRANAGERTVEPATVEITPRGREQARCIAAIVTHAPDLIVTSSYLRTTQTALPLVRRFQNISQTEWPVHEFTYLALDRCRNTTVRERQQLVASYWERSDPFYVDGAGAESFAGLMSRVEDLIKSLRGLRSEFTVIFSHGQFIRAVLWRLLGGNTDISPSAMRQCRSFMASFEVPNGAIVKLQTGSEQIAWFNSVESSHIPIALRTV